ncbi:hypothetical protein GUJ93_ZPchr0007g6234 [Zizania palustris]|uniref:Uncharacterized protein n=1 Tax=Zizania palustris TaxID=103762 RepID=A0A8J5TF43_ZIZPA|nr:hypothetical protein GUJ93_ZPchr0007g6234 [Zizania palustris]
MAMAMAMPDHERAAMSVPLLPRSTFVSSASFSSFSLATSFSSTSSSFSDPAVPSDVAEALPMQTDSFKALAVLRDHLGSVSSLSLCGEFLLSASTGADIVAWQQPDLRRFARFGHGVGSVKALAAAGGRVFSAHQDGRVRVWRVSRRSKNAFKLVAALPTTRDYLGKMFRHASYMQTRRNHRHLWIEHADSISCLTVHDGVVYSGSWDKTLKVWRISDLKCLESILAHDDAINAVAADNGIIYSASADGRVKAWEKGKSTHFLHGILISRDGVSWNALVVIADDGDRRVYGAGSDGHVVGWVRVDRGSRWSLACDVKAHDMAVLCMCVAGDLMCTGSADKTIGLWRRQTNGGLARVGVIGGHEGPVKCIQASWCRVSNGCMVYSGGLDKSIRVWWVPNDWNWNQANEQQVNDTKDHKNRVFLR